MANDSSQMMPVAADQAASRPLRRQDRTNITTAHPGVTNMAPLENQRPAAAAIHQSAILRFTSLEPSPSRAQAARAGSHNAKKLSAE